LRLKLAGAFLQTLSQRASQQPLFPTGGTFWIKSELFLMKIRTLNFDCRASRDVWDFSLPPHPESPALWVGMNGIISGRGGLLFLFQ